MKQNKVILILGVVGLVLWAYTIYSSIPLAKHLNFNTLKMILENMLSIESLVTPAGFIIAIAGAVISNKIAVIAGGVISLVMPVYGIIDSGNTDIFIILSILISAVIIVISAAGKKIKL